MSLSQPAPPDAGVLAGTQTALNTSAAQTQQGLNEISQYTPYGSLTYTNDGAYTSLSPQQQRLLGQYQTTQGSLGRSAGRLAGNVAQMYSKPPDFSSASAPLVQSQMDAFSKYMAPIFKQQESNLDSKLVNQGLGQGGEAWTNAQRAQKTSEDQAAQSALMQFEPQAFSQAQATYNQPMQTMAGLFGGSAPASLPQNLITTPQVNNLQPANYIGTAEQQYGQQSQNFNNTMTGLSSIGSAAVKGLFGMPPVPGAIPV